MDEQTARESPEPALLAAGIALVHVPGLAISRVEFTEHQIQLALESGEPLTVASSASLEEVLAALESATGIELPERFDPAAPFPSEPLDERTKWVELLRDLGEAKGILTGLRPGARYRRVRRVGPVAEVTCSWRGAERTARIDLADGRLPVGTGDDLAELFTD